ncbi:sensor histidine kinase [Cohnella zeiphila]|uniref:histidine kinase n=1 Tax=Cohnella zeiphila TaxID=2761120 RepID=A0A7X0SSM0_9BACL|nr:sensor histidine kinase [Cohnella zeiphila]MBB6735236.1 hypothetical protein [Cohnella zeiphila]
MSRKKRWSQILLGSAVAMFALLLACGTAGAAASAVARDGVLDLRGQPLGSGEVVALEGDWLFDWYGDGSEAPVSSTLTVPGMWGASKLGNGYKPKDQGKGVYRLTLLHDKLDRAVAIRLPNISTSYRLFVDGRQMIAMGTPGSEAALTTPYQLPATVFLDGREEKTELRLEVANFDHRSGGIRTNLILGDAQSVQKFVFNKEAQEMIVFGSLVMIGLYHLGLYVMRRKEAANLFFALLCLFVAMRMGVIGQGLFFRWIPELTWTAGTRIEYSSFALSALFGFAYYQRMYPHEFPKSLLWLSRLGGAALTALIWAMPVLKVSSLIGLFQAYVMLLGACALGALLVSSYRKREGALLAIVGVGGLLLTVVNDIFFYNGWWRSFDLVSFGLLFLVLMNSFAISLRFARTFVRAEQMSAELKEWNYLLEERIAERTEELRMSYADLEESKLGLERMEQSRRQLVSNISHDLRTPMTLLQGYLEALRDGVISDPKQRDATIRSMIMKVEGLNGLIQDLFELSMLEARRVSMAYETVRLADWRSRLHEEYEPEMREKGIAFSSRVEDDTGGLAAVRIDEHRMDRVLANLIYNAMRHTPPGGAVTLLFKADEARNLARIDVADTGPGIHPDDLPHLFERFYKSDKTRHSSSGGGGLGLSIAREIVETHDGHLSAANGEAEGSVFTILLPLYDVVGAEAL